MLGGTLMRQHAFVFDIEKRRVGISHATCSHNPNQITSIDDLTSEGQYVGIQHDAMVLDQNCKHAQYVYKKKETSAGTTIRSKIPPSKA